MNKDLVLREKLALQRTILANQSTFLSFLRTSMYFLMAGLTVQNIFSSSTFTSTNYWILEVILFIVSAFVLLFGIFNFFRHKRKIEESEQHVGNFKEEYLK
ncbi:MAG TPA: DUF202 domain-containing protein [Saprospiraceae bacterium]|nr:DUF202 domain-containing protein [Saprospiraceae bacterium]